MKKITKFFAMAAAVVLAIACSKEEAINEVQSGDLVNVTFTAQMPGLATKAAISDGTKAVDLYFEVYDANLNKIGALRQVKKNAFTDLKAEISVQLVKGETYNFVFWAQDPACNAYNVENLNRITVDYKNISSQDETRDAFYATVENLKVNGAFSEPVTLRRPFAQLNIASTMFDYESAKAAGIEVNQSSVKVESIANVLLPFTDAVEGEETVEFALANIPAETLVVKIKNHAGTEVNTPFKWYSMNYLLVAAEEKDLVKVDAVLAHNNGQIPVTVANVPVQRNYRTNILGDLLTATGKFVIEIDPIYNTPDFIYPGTQEEKLAFAATNGGEVTLTEDAVISSTIVVEGDMIINLNGHSITNKAENTATDVIVVNEGATLIINGEGTVEAVSGNDGYAVIANGKVTINGGTYKAGLDANGETNAVIYARGNGEVYVNGGEFPNDNTSRFVLNKKDADRATTVIEVKGGKFVNFDPANNAAEGAGTNFVADGYSSVEVDGYYVVGKSVSAVADFAEAVNTLPVVNVDGAINNGSNVTAINDNDVVINMNGNEIIAGGQGTNNYAFNVSGSDVEVNDANLNGAGFAVLAGSNVTVNSGKIAAKPGKSGRNMFYIVGNSSVIVKEGTYTFDRTSCYFVYVEAGSTCYIEGGHYEKPLANNASKDSFVNNASAGTVVITGGTFNVDPSKWVPAGYKATKSGKIWTVTKE